MMKGLHLKRHWLHCAQLCVARVRCAVVVCPPVVPEFSESETPLTSSPLADQRPPQEDLARAARASRWEVISMTYK